jgi:hypothetical protein
MAVSLSAVAASHLPMVDLLYIMRQGPNIARIHSQSSPHSHLIES